MSDIIKWIYRTLRSVLFGIIMATIGIYMLIYVALSLPFVQNEIRHIAESEVSKFLKTDVRIGKLMISPFSQVVLDDVEIPDPNGMRCIKAGQIGAGISLRELLYDKKIVITYAEIVELDAAIRQPQKDAPLNIQFIIDAFKPKEKNKPPTKFDLKIRNVVIRRTSATFDKEWIAPDKNPKKIDFNHLSVKNVALDVTMPRLSNEDFQIDLRRLSLEEKSGFKLNKLSAKIHLTNTELNVSGLEINLPGTSIRPNDVNVSFSSMKEMGNAIANGRHSLKIDNNKITPSDFSAFVTGLSHFDEPIFLSLDVAGDRNAIDIHEFRVVSANERLRVNVVGYISSLANPKNISADMQKLSVKVSAQEMTKIINYLSTLPGKTNEMLMVLGEIDLDARAKYSDKSIDFRGILSTALGRLDIDADAHIPGRKRFDLNGRIFTENLNLQPLLPSSGIGKLIFDIDTDVTVDGKEINGKALADVGLIEYKGNSLRNIHLDASKNGNKIEGELSVADAVADFDAKVDADISYAYKSIIAAIDVRNLEPGRIGFIPSSPVQKIAGVINADMKLAGKDDLTGELHANGIDVSMTNGRNFQLNYVDLVADKMDDDTRYWTLDCDYLNAEMSGQFHAASLPGIFQSMLAKSLPALISYPKTIPSLAGENFNLDVIVKNDNTLTEMFNLPIRLLTEIPVKAHLDGDLGKADFSLDIPYLQQGKDKLIRNTRVKGELNDNLKSAYVHIATIMPNKNGDVAVSVDASSVDDVLSADIGWKFNRKHLYDGKVSLGGSLNRNSETGQLDVLAHLNPSVFHVNDATWNIEPAEISYKDKLVDINNLRVAHGQQYVDINGRASTSPTDTVTIDLSGIDLDYIFETLQINYVTFGGVATGRVKACAAFTSEPKAFTDGLWVQNLSYNGATLGDAELTSSWNHPEKLVEIRADIDGGKGKSAIVDGGVWVTRDSLSFDLDANKINIEFLQPFMQAFCSDVQGAASGKAKLFGTFSDIDLTGRLFADTIRMKLDYTNTYYAGSDSVILKPGDIEIPSFRLYDKYGKSAVLSGWLKHRYFHEPRFEFRIRDARNLLCYDTDSRDNPDWYGTIFGNGGATIKGDPEMVNILVDMTTAPKSTFTFVLNDNEAAADYKFLSFSDRRKEAEEAARPDTVPDFVKAFQKRVEAQQGRPSGYNIDLRATVTPDALITLVMDPIAGDKIRARGSGALQMGYNDDDEMTMYGKYTVDEGFYNFSLQDLILKDFTIRPGSSVTFNGDPMRASLDITAAYRVNTNITDLDPSFASDRDLNRTNVPVEALLLVSGDVESPDIKFDISLPTLNSEVERKVRSIISSEDMMSRQVIYLLALNRFYAPEYMNAGNSGGEFASVASSTLSSQLSSMLGQLSDKWQILPSFRSDKDDFSDMEVDVQLSSRLFNNRLLLNGNLGYRDKSTSSTTFVGDFDIEYLLSRSGNFRLKAYNHYNDQNYYLKSALTTQGIGVVYRHDFNDPFKFIKRMFRKFNSKNKQSDKKVDKR